MSLDKIEEDLPDFPRNLLCLPDLLPDVTQDTDALTTPIRDSRRNALEAFEYMLKSPAFLSNTPALTTSNTSSPEPSADNIPHRSPCPSAHTYLLVTPLNHPNKNHVDIKPPILMVPSIPTIRNIKSNKWMLTMNLHMVAKLSMIRNMNFAWIIRNPHAWKSWML
jgi:hypothetical protein